MVIGIFEDMFLSHPVVKKEQVVGVAEVVVPVVHTLYVHGVGGTIHERVTYLAGFQARLRETSLTNMLRESFQRLQSKVIIL